MLPSTVTEVANWAFLDCRSLRGLVLNEGAKKIGKGAFQCCFHLGSIRLPSTITEVGDESFGGCYELRDVVLNEGIQKIGEEAFQYCRSLENIKFSSFSRRMEALLVRMTKLQSRTKSMK
ncbi:hypothetical protein ACHAXR_000117 [Thalassiosira sp. AJA248-18]